MKSIAQAEREIWIVERLVWTAFLFLIGWALFGCGPDIAPDPPDAGRPCITGVLHENGKLVPEPAQCFAGPGKTASKPGDWTCYLDESATTFTCWHR